MVNVITIKQTKTAKNMEITKMITKKYTLTGEKCSKCKAAIAKELRYTKNNEVRCKLCK